MHSVIRCSLFSVADVYANLPISLIGKFYFQFPAFSPIFETSSALNVLSPRPLWVTINENVCNNPHHIELRVELQIGPVGLRVVFTTENVLPSWLHYSYNWPADGSFYQIDYLSKNWYLVGGCLWQASVSSTVQIDAMYLSGTLIEMSWGQLCATIATDVAKAVKLLGSSNSAVWKCPSSVCFLCG
jgi:hypothetical protein